MIQHVVIFRFQGESSSERCEHARVAAHHLQALKGHVPGMSQLDIACDLGLDVARWDMTLISRHESRAALQLYLDHPLHLAAKSVIDSIVAERAIVDSELRCDDSA